MCKMSNQFNIFFLVLRVVAVVVKDFGSWVYVKVELLVLTKQCLRKCFFYELVLTNEMHHGINFSLVC